MSCSLCMLFKIVKLVSQESKGKTQAVEYWDSFIFAKLIEIINYHYW